MTILGIVLICAAVVTLICDICYGVASAKKVKAQNVTNFDKKRNVAVLLLLLTLVLLVVGIALIMSGNDIFGFVSALGSTATPIFTICFLAFLGSKKYKKSIILLAVTIIFIVLSVWFNTTETEMYGRAIFYAGGTLLTIAGIFMVLIPGVRKVGLAAVIISIIFVFFVSEFFGMKFVSRPNYSSSKNDNSIGNGWDEYDYDDDGDINQNEWEDALGDYMDNAMN